MDEYLVQIEQKIRKLEKEITELRAKAEEHVRRTKAKDALHAAIKAARECGLEVEIKAAPRTERTVEVIYQRTPSKRHKNTSVKGSGRIARIIALIASGKYTPEALLHEVDAQGLSVSSARTALSHLKDPSRLEQWHAPSTIKTDVYGRVHF